MLRKGTEITFRQANSFTGQPFVFSGIIIGHARELRKKFPTELAEITGTVYLVKRGDPYGNIFHHCVYPNEIVAEKSSQE